MIGNWADIWVEEILARCQCPDWGVTRLGNGSSTETVTSYFPLSPECLRWTSIPDLGVGPENWLDNLWSLPLFMFGVNTIYRCCWIPLTDPILITLGVGTSEWICGCVRERKGTCNITVPCLRKEHILKSELCCTDFVHIKSMNIFYSCSYFCCRICILVLTKSFLIVSWT